MAARTHGFLFAATRHAHKSQIQTDEILCIHFCQHPSSLRESPNPRPNEYAGKVGDELIRAVHQGDIKTIVRNLNAGHDPNVQDQYGWTALHWAAAEHRDRIASLLIEAGSSIAARGTEGWTPLHLAAVSQSARVTETLLRAGADVNSQSIHGDTPLHLCVMPEKVDRHLGLRTPWLLLSAGANVNIKNKKGLTPLAEAIAQRARRIEGCIRRHAKQQIVS